MQLSTAIRTFLLFVVPVSAFVVPQQHQQMPVQSTTVQVPARPGKKATAQYPIPGALLEAGGPVAILPAAASPSNRPRIQRWIQCATTPLFLISRKVKGSARFTS